MQSYIEFQFLRLLVIVFCSNILVEIEKLFGQNSILLCSISSQECLHDTMNCFKCVFDSEQRCNILENVLK